MKECFVDLHTHSTASDGTCTPAQLIGQAKREGVGVCALTDHDTLDGLEEAQGAARELGVTFVRGCELSSRCELGTVHILGLWLPREKKRLAHLQGLLQRERRSRTDRNRIIVQKLNAMGIAMDYAALERLAGNAVIGRPHIAQMLMEMGAVGSIKEAFLRYLGKHGAAYAERRQMQPAEAVEVLKKCGALVSLAHPGLIHGGAEEKSLLIAGLKEHGLDAIEVYHSSHDPQTVSGLLGMARHFGLAVTGGSDFHGEHKPNVRLGHVSCGSDGTTRIGKDVYEALRARMHAARHG